MDCCVCYIKINNKSITFHFCCQLNNIKEVVKSLEEKMFEAAEKLEFERANEYKQTIEGVKTTTNKQKINLNDLKNRDVIPPLFEKIVTKENYIKS